MHDFTQTFFSVLEGVFTYEYFWDIILIAFMVSMICSFASVFKRFISSVQCGNSNIVDSIDQAEEDLDDDPEDDSDDDSDEYCEYESEDDSFDYVLKGDDFE